MIPIILPVRRDSQRCPNKILRPFYGEQSILDICLEKLRGRKDVFVAAHEEVFQEKAEHYGVNFLPRSKESALAEDALTVHNYLNDLDCEHAAFMGVCCPLLKVERVDAAIAYYADNQPRVRSLFGAIASYDIIFKPDGSLIDPSNAGLNSKEKKPSWIGANAVYVFNRKRFLELASYWEYGPDDPYLFEIPKAEAWDIDTEEDFLVAQTIYRLEQETS